MRSRRLFPYLMVIVTMCILLPAYGYSREEYNLLPSEYPAEWGVIFGQTQKTGIYPLNPGTSILTKGTVFDAGGPALPCDIIWNRDVPVTLRDGTVIYTDIFRPASSPTDLPAIIAWSPYGKSVPTAPEPTVPAAWFSGLAKGEGPDAAFWCCNGYAVVNPDVRGAYNSEAISTIGAWSTRVTAMTSSSGRHAKAGVTARLRLRATRGSLSYSGT